MGPESDWTFGPKRRQASHLQHRHDDGAQEPENLLHRFLRNNNKDADTSRLDALGELSSVASESIMPHRRLKNGHFKQNPSASQAGRDFGKE
jgi:hypothetical protein